MSKELIDRLIEKKQSCFSFWVMSPEDINKHAQLKDCDGVYIAKPNLSGFGWNILGLSAFALEGIKEPQIYTARRNNDKWVVFNEDGEVVEGRLSTLMDMLGM